LAQKIAVKNELTSKQSNENKEFKLLLDKISKKLELTRFELAYGDLSYYQRTLPRAEKTSSASQRDQNQ